MDGPFNVQLPPPPDRADSILMNYGSLAFVVGGWPQWHDTVPLSLKIAEKTKQDKTAYSFQEYIENLKSAQLSIIFFD